VRVRGVSCRRRAVRHVGDGGVVKRGRGKAIGNCFSFQLYNVSEIGCII
jgi:hypothetical protein